MIAFDSEVAAVVRFVVDNTNHDVVKLMNILGHVRQCTWCAQGSWKSTFKKSVRTMSQGHFSGPFELCKKKGGYTGPTVVDVVENVENGVVESGDSTNGEETERESGGEMPLASPMGGNLGTTPRPKPFFFYFQRYSIECQSVMYAMSAHPSLRYWNWSKRRDPCPRTTRNIILPLGSTRTRHRW